MNTESKNTLKKSADSLFTAGLAVCLCAFLAAMVFGVVKRQTYKDILKQENYLDQLTVAELPEDLVERQWAFLIKM